MDRNKQYPAELFTWLIILMQMPVLYYGTIPISDLYRIFQSGKDRIPGRDGAPGVAEIGESEFQELLRGIIAMRSIPGIAGTPGAEAAGLTCWIDGDEVVAISNADDLKAIRAEKKKWKVSTRILNYDEVMQVITKGYIETPESRQLETYLKEKWQKSDAEAVTIIRHLAIGFRTGDDFGVGLNELSRALGTNTPEKSVTMDELNEMVSLVMNLYHVTGQMDRGGWAPAELAKQRYGTVPHIELGPDGMPKGPLPEGVILVPGSAVSAAVMQEHGDELRRAGVNFDVNASASRYAGKVVTPEGTVQRGRPRKVYPNDPCPCGSGRKFRDCHGRGK